MIRTLFTILCAGLFSSCVFAAENNSLLRLGPVSIDVRDVKSVERGAEGFKKSCAVCHTMKYLEYDEITRKFMGADPQDNWEDIMAPKHMFGMIVPDMSLIARIRSPEWIYTYLRSYYKDETKPSGYSNLLKNNAMPNPFIALMQDQRLIEQENQKDNAHTEAQFWYKWLEDVGPDGTMDADEFDQYLVDIVTYLTYASDPMRAQRLAIAPWVLIYLAVMVVLTYAVYRSYARQYK